MKGTGCDETDQNRLYNGVSELQGDLAVGIIQKNRSMREMKNRERVVPNGTRQLSSLRSQKNLKNIGEEEEKEVVGGEKASGIKCS